MRAIAHTCVHAYAHAWRSEEGRAEGPRGTPVEHSFTNARACEPTDAGRAATCVTYVAPCTRARGLQVRSLIPLHCSPMVSAPRSIAREKERDGTEGPIAADKRTSASARVYSPVCSQKTMRCKMYNGIFKGRKIVQE